jgi:uncharacterized protein with PIN domain
MPGCLPPCLYDRHREEFWRCRQCGRFYWPGSHYDAMWAKFREVAATEAM